MKRPTKREMALSLHAAGRPMDEIARALSVPVGLVRRWLREERKSA